MGAIGALVAGVVSFLTTSTLSTIVRLGLAAFSIASSMSSAREQRKAAAAARMQDIQRNAFRNFRQALTPRRIVFGRCRVAGPLVFAHNRKKHGTHFVVALAAHEVQEIESVWILEDELPFRRMAPNLGRVSGKYHKSVILRVFTGTTTQDIGQAMVDAVDVRPLQPPTSLDPLIIEATDRFKGIAAIHAVTRQWSEYFEGETPEFAAIIKGHKGIYDPRTDTTGYTANPALCAAWYLTAIMGFAWDSLDPDALELAADVCDGDVPLKAGGTEKRYECHGVISADMQHREVLDLLARSMAGVIRYASGKWMIQAGAPTVGTPIDLTEDRALDGYKVLYDPPDRSLPNAVRGSCVDIETWQPRAYPQRRLGTAIAAEGGPWWLDIDLPLTTSHTMAQRIAKIELLRARARKRFTIELDLRGLRAKPGSLVTWSAPEIGMDAELFEVDVFGFAARDGKAGKVLGTRLDLVEYSADFFAWNAATDEQEGASGVAIPGGIGDIAPPDGCYDETITVESGENFAADYDIHWEDPAIDEATLDFIRAQVRVTITWDNAGTPEETTHTDSADIDPGTEEALLPITATQAGWNYVSRSVEVTLIAYYGNGTNSAGTLVDVCPLPTEPGDTLHGVASAGDFEITEWELETLAPGSYANYAATGWLGWGLTHDLITGDAWIYTGPSRVLERLGGSTTDPRGVYVATPDAEDLWNGGDPWTYTVS